MGAFGDLFDSPWKILIIAVVIIVLFGSRKLPEAARSLGRSMRILKSEVKGLHDDDEPESAEAAPAQAAPAQIQAAQQAPSQQAQIDALQQQLNNLQSPAASNGAPAAETQQTH
jgi:sec-independent protein translocase protein TatA